MCGRFTHLFTWKQLHRLMDLSAWPPDELTPRYNVAPTQVAPVVRARGSGGREGALLRWGLIPSWADDPGIGGRLINARAETAETKPAFRSSFKRRRCLVPISGFYEWQVVPDSPRKQPYYIRPDGDEPFVLAGLWDRWAGADEPIDSFTILTTGPNDLMRPLHDRMPVILPREAWGAWLGDDASAGARLPDFFHPFDPSRMRAYPVSTRVNRPSHDAPDCTDPLDPR